jgi:hypothetical protein
MIFSRGVNKKKVELGKYDAKHEDSKEREETLIANVLL